MTGGMMRMFINEPGLLSRGTGNEAWAAGVRRWSHVAGPVVRDAMKAKAPVSPKIGKYKGSGAFRNSIQYQSKLTPPIARLEFGSPLFYAKFIRDGTRPHEIKARNRPTLAFQTFDGGPWSFPKVVQHPGTRPNEFARRAIRPTLPELREAFSTIMSEAYGGNT